MVTELKHVDTRPGPGAEAVKGQTVTVHYTGWLYDAGAQDHHGRKFDSSRDRNELFSFRLGAGEVIQGWDDGVAGMKVGGARTLTIPSSLGYGARGAGGRLQVERRVERQGTASPFGLHGRRAQCPSSVYTSRPARTKCTTPGQASDPFHPPYRQKRSCR